MAKVELTRRQAQVIRLAAIGRSDREIAGELGISPNSIGVHLTRIRNLLGPGCTRRVMPGVALLLGLVSIADLTREALVMLQGLEGAEN